MTELRSNKLVRAFLQNKIIAPIPDKYTKNLKKADNFRRLCESKINKPIVGFKAGGSMAIKDYLNIKYTHLGIK